MKLIQFASREEWLEARRGGVGGSDVAAILGLSKWASPLSLYCRKVGITDDDEENEAMKWGHILEPHVVAALSDEAGVEIDHIDNAIVRHPEFPALFCSPDGITREDTPRLVEAKTTHAFKASEWDEGPPEMYWHQVQHSLECCDIDRALIAVLIGGQVFRWCEIERDPDWWGNHGDALLDFARRIIEEDPPPVTGSDADDAVLGEMFPSEMEKRVTPLSVDFLDIHEEIERIDAQAKALKARRQMLRQQIKEAIGMSEYGLLPGGMGAYRWSTVSKRSYVVKASSYRQLTHVQEVKE